MVNEIMEQKNITKYQLSKATGIPYTTVSDICNGKTRIEKCSSETIYKIAKELGINMEALIEPIMTERAEFEAFLKEQLIKVAKEYHIKKVALFGSRATGTNRNNSDVDLIVEFSDQISLLTLSSLKLTLEELIGLKVDLIHGPLKDSDLIKVNKVVEIYAA